jgi:hypothetical protein
LEHTDSLGDSSPNRRNILVVGAKGTGKTFLLQQWIVKFSPNKVPLVLHEKEDEWNGLKVESLKIGLLNRKSYLKEIVGDRTIIVDDALNLVKNWADKLLGLASVNRSSNTSYVLSLQGLGVLKERKDALGVVDTIIFFQGSEACAFLVKNSTRFSKEVELIRKEIENLKPHEILVYDRFTNLWYKTTNENVQLLNELLTKPLTMGQKLEAEKQPSEGSSKNFQLQTKKNRIECLIQEGRSRGEIIREVGTTAGYLTKTLSELRLEGCNIPRLKAGRPRAAQTAVDTICNSSARGKKRRWCKWYMKKTVLPGRR